MPLSGGGGQQRSRHVLIALLEAVAEHFVGNLFALAEERSGEVADDGGAVADSERRKRKRRRTTTKPTTRRRGWEECFDEQSTSDEQQQRQPLTSSSTAAAAVDLNNNNSSFAVDADAACVAAAALFGGRGCRSQRLRALSQVYELLVRNRRATKRDLFYEHKLLYGTQRNFDRALSALCKCLNASRTELHVMGCSRGFAIGDLCLHNGMDDETVDFHTTPVALFESLVHFEFVQSAARFLLVVEKDAIFQRLLDERFMERFPHSILVTGRGYPDICTRQFLHWLATRLPGLSMLALVDADPYGVDILFTYKFGASRSAVEAGADTRLPALRWLGFLPSEAHQLTIPQNQFLLLTENDRRRIQKLTHRATVQANGEQGFFNYELSVMLNNGWKLELEALCAVSASYLSAVYLDHKLLAFNNGNAGGGGGAEQQNGAADEGGFNSSNDSFSFDEEPYHAHSHDIDL